MKLSVSSKENQKLTEIEILKANNLVLEKEVKSLQRWLLGVTAIFAISITSISIVANIDGNKETACSPLRRIEGQGVLEL